MCTTMLLKGVFEYTQLQIERIYRQKDTIRSGVQ